MGTDAKQGELRRGCQPHTHTHTHFLVFPVFPGGNLHSSVPPNDVFLSDEPRKHLRGAGVS